LGSYKLGSLVKEKFLNTNQQKVNTMSNITSSQYWGEVYTLAKTIAEEAMQQADNNRERGHHLR
jgi:hypothetical protein